MSWQTTDGGLTVSHRLRVAAVQMTSGTDSEANLEQAVALVRHAAGLEARYVQLPEYASFWGPASYYPQAAQTLDGEFVTTMAALAQSLGISIHVGSFLEQTGQGYANTSVLLGSSGARAVYRKMHLFDVDVPGGVTYRESAAIEAGSDMVIATDDEAVFGLSICFDVRFPELYRSLSLAGANILCVPAAFSAVTGPPHWEVLLRARAIENGAFVVAAAQVGTTAEGLATHGHALVISPWGELLAEATAEGLEVVVADLDLELARQRRAQIDTLGLRRAHLYGGAVQRIAL